MPIYLSEEELDQRFQTKSRLASGGEYGCGCLVFEGNQRVDGNWVSDDGVDKMLKALPQELEAKWGHADIGTVVIAGNLCVNGNLEISDRLMCLIVLGDLEADGLTIRETEVFVSGDAVVASLEDCDGYLTVVGSLSVGDGT